MVERLYDHAYGCGYGWEQDTTSDQITETRLRGDGFWEGFWLGDELVLPCPKSSKLSAPGSNLDAVGRHTKLH